MVNAQVTQVPQFANIDHSGVVNAGKGDIKQRQVLVALRAWMPAFVTLVLRRSSIRRDPCPFNDVQPPHP